MRVLIAYKESHRAYGDVLEGIVRALRPHVELETCRLGALGPEVSRFDPHLVVSSRANTVDPDSRAAWVLLSHEPDEPSEVCLDGRRSASQNPELDDLLAIIDETEKLIREGRLLGGC